MKPAHGQNRRDFQDSHRFVDLPFDPPVTDSGNPSSPPDRPGQLSFSRATIRGSDRPSDPKSASLPGFDQGGRLGEDVFEPSGGDDDAPAINSNGVRDEVNGEPSEELGPARAFSPPGMSHRPGSQGGTRP